MPTDGFDSTCATEEQVALQAMAAGHTNERIGVEAPLLAANNADVQDQRGSHDEPLQNPRSRRSGDRFVWALTFSAGISGLLFGYEYGNKFSIYHSHRQSLLTFLHYAAPE